jgi:hypothetical protein
MLNSLGANGLSETATVNHSILEFRNFFVVRLMKLHKWQSDNQNVQGDDAHPKMPSFSYWFLQSRTWSDFSSDSVNPCGSDLICGSRFFLFFLYWGSDFSSFPLFQFGFPFSGMAFGFIGHFRSGFEEA